MANVINLPTYEQTEEIRQNVEDIGTLVNDTSGVFIGTDGKKYKGVFEQGIIEKRLLHSELSASIHKMYADDDYLYVFASNTINAFDKNTLEHVKATSGVMPQNNVNDFNFAHDDDALYYRSSSSAVIKLNKSTWQVNTINNAVGDGSALFVYNGLIHAVGTSGQIGRFNGTSIVQVHNVGSATVSPPAITGVSRVYCDGRYCFGVFKTSTGTNGHYIKFDPENGSILAMVASQWHANAAIFDISTRQIAITENTSNTALLNRNTLAVETYIRATAIDYDYPLNKFIIVRGTNNHDVFLMNVGEVNRLRFSGNRVLSEGTQAANQLVSLGNGKIVTYYTVSNMVIVLYEITNQLIGYEEVI